MFKDAVNLAIRLFASVAATTVVIGVVGMESLQTHEGLRLSSYRDPVGIWTICWGHTGPEVKAGLRYTKEQCEYILAQDIIKHQVVLYGPKSCIGNALQPYTNRMDAVTSFTFNVGTNGFCKSTMARKLRAGDYDGASREFPKWVYAKGQKFPGLVKRRADEQALFNSTENWKPYVIKSVVSP